MGNNFKQDCCAVRVCTVQVWVECVQAVVCLEVGTGGGGGGGGKPCIL